MHVSCFVWLPYGVINDDDDDDIPDALIIFQWYRLRTAFASVKKLSTSQGCSHCFSRYLPQNHFRALCKSSVTTFDFPCAHCLSDYNLTFNVTHFSSSHHHPFLKHVHTIAINFSVPLLLCLLFLAAALIQHKVVYPSISDHT